MIKCGTLFLTGFLSTTLAASYEGERKIEVKSQVPIQVVYKGNVISNNLRIDLLIEDTIIVELKSVEELNSLHYKQIRTYLKLTNKPLGWLINFNEDDFAHGMIKVPNRYFNSL